MEKYYVGIDLHRDFFVAVAQNEKGEELLRERYVNSLESVESLLARFDRPPVVVVEATRNWMWFTATLQTRGCDVQLAHPLRVKAIASARIKTDSIDAKTLCDLLRADLIPRSYIATYDELDNRELSRGRISMVHDQTLLKNRLMAILGKDNLRFSGTDMFGARGREWLGAQRLSDAKRTIVNIYLGRLDDIKASLEQLDSVIKSKSGGLSEVSLLQTIPGLGPTTAFILAAEIGDIDRFSSSKKFAAYFGLVPRLSQSGYHAYYGRITKLGNPHVRWVLGQAAHRLARTNGEYRRFVARISFRGGKKKAIVALSRRLSTIVWCVLKEKRPYVNNYSRGSRPVSISERIHI